MKIILSPAKTLDFENNATTTDFTQGVFLEQAEKLNAVLKKKSPKKLTALMGISPKLAELNWQRNQDWQLPFTLQNAKQAIFAFKGDVYIGLDAMTIKKEKITQLQNKVRILSGQYGLLKPLDLIQAYRLEMGTKLKIGRKDNLYKFWDAKITDALNAEMNSDEILVNLASNEYYKVIQPKKINAQIITPIFKDFKNGKLKVISFFAKKARGLMARYIIDNNVQTIDVLKKFNSEDYAFDTNLSSEKELVFTR